MNSQQEQFLNLRTLPARLKVEEAAWYLGFAAHEIPILMAEGLLKPLGRPPATGVKHFSTAALEELRRDEKWLARASDCIVHYWKGRNEKKAAHRNGRHDAPHDATVTPSLPPLSLQPGRHLAAARE
jgi:hypothetical protein